MIGIIRRDGRAWRLGKRKVDRERMCVAGGEQVRLYDAGITATAPVSLYELRYNAGKLETSVTVQDCYKPRILSSVRHRVLFILSAEVSVRFAGRL
ncbi:hypothetical protein J6590_076759 [Homalodisca vitripennis]|nr:hypothetical protein J6590_076759 [Homalodisca vitripennis]